MGGLLTKATGRGVAHPRRREDESMIECPEWVPDKVVAHIQYLSGYMMPNELRNCLCRLATDDRMRRVWQELMKRHRSAPGAEGGAGYLYPAKPTQKEATLDPLMRQERALGETLHVVFTAVCQGRQAWRPAEIESTRTGMLAEAATLRRVAASVFELAQANFGRTMTDATIGQVFWDAQAVMRVADMHESNAAALASDGDPIRAPYLRKDHDDLTRGVQGTLVAFFTERFGKSLLEVAARITEVALNTTTTASVGRAAKSRAKTHQKNRDRSP